MFKLIAFLSIAGIACAQYTAQDAADYFDKDKDGIISDAEFTEWHHFITALDKTGVLMGFTGPIFGDVFECKLWAYEYWMQSKGFPPSQYTPTDAANFADANKDGLINANEFDTWYGAMVDHTGSLLKSQMANDAGVITKESFVGVLNYAGNLLSKK